MCNCLVITKSQKHFLITTTCFLLLLANQLYKLSNKKGSGNATGSKIMKSTHAVITIPQEQHTIF